MSEYRKLELEAVTDPRRLAQLILIPLKGFKATTHQMEDWDAAYIVAVTSHIGEQRL